MQSLFLTQGSVWIRMACGDLSQAFCTLHIPINSIHMWTSLTSSFASLQGEVGAWGKRGLAVCRHAEAIWPFLAPDVLLLGLPDPAGDACGADAASVCGILLTPSMAASYGPFRYSRLSCR